MKVEDYKLLATIRREGTIRAAANTLHISQPAISLRLKQIEHLWDQKLFIRSYKRMIPTLAGEKVIAFAEKTLEGEEKLRDDLSRIAETIGGRLSLGVSSVVGQYSIPSLLGKYIEKYPDVKVELVTGLSEEIVQSKSDFHVIIVRGDKAGALNHQLLFSDRLYLIGRKYLSNSKDRPLIEFQSDLSLHTKIDEWFSANREWSTDQKIKVDQIETCKQLMIHGVGMAVLPEVATRDLNEATYTFQSLELDGKPLTRDTWLCFDDPAKELPQVQAFLEMFD
ncbi:LysR family transcriptional regulator [Salipaludibacillus keqinensis]|uniref:LysR family transcriptional regulator n=1 Tax=Salipaludibacillus keqinensis TaxID=2045207 RepID=A0A323TLK9_9BACI|nr:LysR family transcriptional regulator [Salipaludibacillus keqinensis]PYZ94637.1 LysR family transcriptional regulator [Salipaludibacillus keqinensis]